MTMTFMGEMLTRSGAVEMQAIQSGGECCPEYLAKRDNDPTRHEQDLAA
jgi:hypothetical protein